MSALPKTVGRYRVIAQLGQGGMARVLLGMSEGPGGFRKLSVIKQLRKDLDTSEDYASMFLEEARLSGLLNHPNVVQTNEIGEDESFISMEYLEGQSLSRALRRAERKLPLGLHLWILSEALTGLHYVHELSDLAGNPLRVVHRDISPGNLFLTYDGQVKLLDFGIAKAAGSKFQTRAGMFKGKIAYTAPEQAQGEPVDRRADIFAAGVLLWEALAERSLAASEASDLETLQKRAKGVFACIDETAPDAPAELRGVCRKAMAIDPDDRYATAQEFRDALHAAAESCGIDIGSNEALAVFMSEHFAEERQGIAALIAKTVSVKDSLDDDELAATWEASDVFWLNPEDLETCVTTKASTVRSLSGKPTQELRAPKGDTGAKPRRRMPMVAALFGLVLIAGALIGTYGPGLGQEPQLDASSVGRAAHAVGAPDALSARDAAATTVQWMIIITPSAASLSLDGEKLPNPYEETRVASPGLATLVASAPGYLEMRRSIPLDRDINLELTLQRLLPKADAAPPRRRRDKIANTKPIPPDASPVTEKKEPQPGDRLVPKGGKTTRQIDKDNPYQ